MNLIVHAALVGCCLMLAGSIVVTQAQTPPAPVPAAPASTETTNPSSPRIQFDNLIWDFGRAPSSETQKHTFYFTNVGSATLELSQVQPGCGCTTAGEWSRKVEPGQVGSIPIQFSGANFDGPIFKTVGVYSNDKQQPNVALQIKGTIWKPVAVVPQLLMLNVMPDASAASNVVQVTVNGEEPMDLWQPESNNPLFHANLITNKPGKNYQVMVTASPGTATNANTQGQITIKTSLASMPIVTVTAYANIQPAIMLVPPQIVLPSGPLAAAATPELTIQNNGGQMIALSDVAVNLPGVDVTVTEKVPGRSFLLKFAFPAGFEIPAGQPAMLTARSTSPQMPVIKVPIVQNRRVVSVPPVLPGSGQ